MIAGPNGAGKTTTALALQPDLLRIYEYINADEIARGLAASKNLYKCGHIALSGHCERLSRYDSLAALLSIRVEASHLQDSRPFWYHNRRDCSDLRIGSLPLENALQAPLEVSSGPAAMMTTHAFLDSARVEEG